MTNHRISVVIPTFERCDLVRETVQSLALQEITTPFEVIVVVDGSTDGTADALRALDLPFRLTIIEQPNEGVSSARNAGAERATGDVILFLDDDMEAHSQLLDQHARSHRGGAQVVLGHFPLHPKAPKNLLSELVHQWVETRRAYLADGTTRQLSERHMYDFHVAQMSVRREAFKAVGGFSSTFTSGGAFGNEDYDLGYRLLKDGYRIVFNPDAITWQQYVVTPRYYLQRARQAGRADVAFARRYPEQQQKLFELRSIRRRIHPVLRQPSEIRWLSEIIRVALRGLAVMLFRWGRQRGRFGRKVKALFFEVERLEYWAGVRDAGDIPAPHPVRVLCYSAVADRHLSERAVSPARFREQLLTMRRAGYHFIDAREFIALLEGGNVPANPVLVTLDNGLESVPAALSTLRELHVPAVAFVNNRATARSIRARGEAMDIPPARFTAAQLPDWAAEDIEAGYELASPAGTDPADAALRTAMRDGLDFLRRFGTALRLFAHTRADEHNPTESAGESSRLTPAASRCTAGIQAAAAAEGVQAVFTRTPCLISAGDDRYQLGRLEIRQSDRGRRLLKRVRSVRRAPLREPRTRAKNVRAGEEIQT